MKKTRKKVRKIKSRLRALYYTLIRKYNDFVKTPLGWIAAKVGFTILSILLRQLLENLLLYFT